MKFLKDTLGNIVLMDSSDSVMKWPDVATQLILSGAGDAVTIMQAATDDYTVFAADIDSYQVLPAASVAFAGTAPDLIDILKDYFFLNSSVIGPIQDVNIVSSIPLDVNVLTSPPVNIDIDKSAFGESITAQLTAFVQNTGVYEFIPSNFRQYSSGTGAGTGIVNRMFSANNGTSVGGYGAIQSLRSLNYNSGQGGRARFTAVFPTNTANHWQGVGLMNLTDELSFGYDGTVFGIWHRYGGVAEVRTITVTGAASGATNLTLTLNGTAYVIPLTAGTTAFNAYQIAEWLNANQLAWDADQIGNTVIISAQSDGAKSGVYSYSHATSTGTIVQSKAGITKTSTHIPKTTWSLDTCAWLDPTKGNVYQISYPYLGFGAIRFFVKPIGQPFKLVHVIEYENANTLPSLRQPSLRFGIYSASIGTTTNVECYCASVALFVEGEPQKTRNPRYTSNTQTVSTTLTNVLSIRNRRTYNNIYNQVEITPIFISVASESNQNVIVEIRINPTFSGATNFANVGTNLVSDVDITANTVTGGTPIVAFTLGAKGTLNESMKDLEIRIPPSLIYSIAARVTSGASAAITVTQTYYEDL